MLKRPSLSWFWRAVPHGRDTGWPWRPRGAGGCPSAVSAGLPPGGGRAAGFLKGAGTTSADLPGRSQEGERGRRAGTLRPPPPARPGPPVSQVSQAWRGPFRGPGRSCPEHGERGQLGTRTTARLPSALMDAGQAAGGGPRSFLSRGRSSRAGARSVHVVLSFSSSIRGKDTRTGAGVQGSLPTCRRAWGLALSAHVSSDPEKPDELKRQSPKRKGLGRSRLVTTG